MSRLLSLSLLGAGLLGASLGRADDIASVDYFLPVSYDMVITRSVVSSETSDRSTLSYELFNSRALLRSILEANGVTSLTNWSLVAQGNTAAFSDSHTTDTLSSLKIVARNSKTKEIKEPAEAIAISLAPASETAALSRTERQDVTPVTTPATVVASTARISRLAQVTQKLPARTDYPAAGTVDATGLVVYTNAYNKVSVGDDTTATQVLRPTGATFRASGVYVEDGEGSATDGMVEVLITLGSPTYAKPVPVE